MMIDFDWLMPDDEDKTFEELEKNLAFAIDLLYKMQSFLEDEEKQKEKLEKKNLELKQKLKMTGQKN